MYYDDNNYKNNISILSRFFRKRTKRLLTNIDRLFSKIIGYEIICTSIFVIFGVLLLLNANLNNIISSMVFGILTIVFGLINLYSYSKRRDISLFQFFIGYGIIGIILGILIIMNPFFLSKSITLFVGLWGIYIFLMTLDLAIRCKIIGESSWIITLVSALLEIFMSTVVLINPFDNLLLSEVAGAFLVLIGILKCANLILVKNRSIDFLENI